jgi:hypothetical protein
MKMITKIIAAAISLASTASYAADSTAQWAVVGHWNVFSSSIGYCGMTGQYADGSEILVGEGKNGWVLTVSGPKISTKQDAVYTIHVSGENGSKGTFTATGFKDHTLVFPNLGKSSVYQLATNKSFSIEGVGTYSLPKSFEAIKSVDECWKSLQSATAETY